MRIRKDSQWMQKTVVISSLYLLIYALILIDFYSILSIFPQGVELINTIK